MLSELYLGYVLATIAVLVVPGPTIVLVISYALAHGRRSALACVVGVGLGDATGVTVSLIGLGAILAASATLFTILKWVGALYLIWLGIKMWRATPVSLVPTANSVPSTAGTGETRSMIARTWLVTALNPKGIAFYVAFLPHFVDGNLPVAPQFVLLGTTFVVLGMVNALLYAIFASSLRQRLRNPTAVRSVNRIGGSFLIGAGLLTAAVRRAV